ncbi:MAG: glutathione S-transferase [Pseudomonadota bacterium]
MKLYDGGRAPNPRRVQIFMKEKGLEIPTIQLDLNAHEHRSEAMAAKNPAQTVPFLELDDGTIISETIAICRYLESLHPEPNMLGVTALDQAIVEMWNRRVEFGFFLKVAQSFRHLHPGAAILEGEQIPDWGLKNQKQSIEYLSILDAQLASSTFIAGDRFSVADITALVASQFFKPARLQVPETGYENYKRWLAEVSARPSVQL